MNQEGNRPWIGRGGPGGDPRRIACQSKVDEILAAAVLGVALVIVGAYFLLREYVPAFDADRFWPIALIVLGVVLLVAAIRPRSGDGGSSG